MKIRTVAQYERKKAAQARRHARQRYARNFTIHVLKAHYTSYMNAQRAQVAIDRLQDNTKITIIECPICGQFIILRGYENVS